MKKVLDSVTLLGHVFATLEKWAENPRDKCIEMAGCSPGL
jgi:hypothetical protein